ncbi:MAG: hypothetical protein QNJ45_19080 [Ardenticatenaceae bacterium]|nr:hypothetical protein [Ardenticatenaceae bacterium]
MGQNGFFDQFFNKISEFGRGASQDVVEFAMMMGAVDVAFDSTDGRTEYWPDGRIKSALDGTEYWPNGQLKKSNNGVDYWPNGQIHTTSSGEEYWPNGQLKKARNGIEYWPNGDIKSY